MQQSTQLTQDAKEESSSLTLEEAATNNKIAPDSNNSNLEMIIEEIREDIEEQNKALIASQDHTTRDTDQLRSQSNNINNEHLETIEKEKDFTEYQDQQTYNANNVGKFPNDYKPEPFNQNPAKLLHANNKDDPRSIIKENIEQDEKYNEKNTLLKNQELQSKSVIKQDKLLKNQELQSKSVIKKDKLVPAQQFTEVQLINAVQAVFDDNKLYMMKNHKQYHQYLKERNIEIPNHIQPVPVDTVVMLVQLKLGMQAIDTIDQNYKKAIDTIYKNAITRANIIWMSIMSYNDKKQYSGFGEYKANIKKLSAALANYYNNAQVPVEEFLSLYNLKIANAQPRIVTFLALCSIVSRNKVNASTEFRNELQAFLEKLQDPSRHSGNTSSFYSQMTTSLDANSDANNLYSGSDNDMKKFINNRDKNYTTTVPLTKDSLIEDQKQTFETLIHNKNQEQTIVGIDSDSSSNNNIKICITEAENDQPAVGSIPTSESWLELYTNNQEKKSPYTQEFHGSFGHK